MGCIHFWDAFILVLYQQTLYQKNQTQCLAVGSKLLPTLYLPTVPCIFEGTPFKNAPRGATLPTLITYTWPTQHKLRGRSNRWLAGAAGNPEPGPAGAPSLRRQPTRNKPRGRMHRSNRAGTGSPGPGQAGAPRLQRQPTRNKLRGTRIWGTASLCRHQQPQQRGSALDTLLATSF